MIGGGKNEWNMGKGKRDGWLDGKLVCTHSKQTQHVPNVPNISGGEGILNRVIG